MSDDGIMTETLNKLVERSINCGYLEALIDLQQLAADKPDAALATLCRWLRERKFDSSANQGAK